jgi:hypothetical protein
MRRISTIILLWAIQSLASAHQLPSPQEHFGFAMGDDYFLPSYKETEATSVRN